jgi:hypothetical protein
MPSLQVRQAIVFCLKCEQELGLLTNEQDRALWLKRTVNVWDLNEYEAKWANALVFPVEVNSRYHN